MSLTEQNLVSTNFTEKKKKAGTTGVLGDRFCIHSEKKERLILTPQDPVSCGGYICNGCMGCVYPYSWLYLELYGTVTESCFPYKSHNTTVLPCAKKCVNPNEEYKKYYAKFGSARYSYFNIDAIKNEIILNGPVAAAMFIYPEYLLYKGGIFVNHSNKIISTHLLKIIGWGTETVNGVPIDYWLMQDSQGEAFRENPQP